MTFLFISQYILQKDKISQCQFYFIFFPESSIPALLQFLNIRSIQLWASQQWSERSLSQNSSKHVEKRIGKGQRNRDEKRGQKRAPISPPQQKKKKVNSLQKPILIQQHSNNETMATYKYARQPMTSAPSKTSLMTSFCRLLVMNTE